MHKAIVRQDKRRTKSRLGWPEFQFELEEGERIVNAEIHFDPARDLATDERHYTCTATIVHEEDEEGAKQ